MILMRYWRSVGYPLSDSVDHVIQLMWPPQGADMAEIRRQYRQLSLRYHPDKDTGNQDKFMKIAKAYEA